MIEMPTIAWILTIPLVVGMVLSFIRLLLGPSLPDRVLAFDAMAIMAVGALVLISIALSVPLLLDVALALALITFLGTVALALSLEKGITE